MKKLDRIKSYVKNEARSSIPCYFNDLHVERIMNHETEDVKFLLKTKKIIAIKAYETNRLPCSLFYRKPISKIIEMTGHLNNNEE